MKVKEIVGSFEIGVTIGEGTFGKVKLGKHLLTQQKVAVKVFDKQKLETKNSVARFNKEIDILKDINHPYLVKFYEAIETAANIYLIMEYVENGQLFDYIRLNKRLSEKTASKFLYQILEALNYLHQNGICHRDIKPQNILLTPQGDIKLVDFGLSTYFDENQQLFSSCGSPCYALPEMLIGQPYNGQEADVWSAGIVLFTMVNGYLPYEDSNIKALYKQIMSEPLEFVPDLSDDLQDLLENLLSKQRSDRYNLQQARFHKWLVKECPQYYTSDKVISAKEQPQYMEELLSQLTTYGVEYKYIKYCLAEKKHNFATTIYYLLEKKHMRDAAAAANAHNNNKSSPSTVESMHQETMPSARNIPVPSQHSKGRESSHAVEAPIQIPLLLKKSMKTDNQTKHENASNNSKPKLKIPKSQEKTPAQTFRARKSSVKIENPVSILVSPRKNKKELTRHKNTKDQAFFQNGNTNKSFIRKSKGHSNPNNNGNSGSKSKILATPGLSTIRSGPSEASIPAGKKSKIPTSPARNMLKEGEYFVVACQTSRNSHKKTSMYQQIQSSPWVSSEYQDLSTINVLKSPRHQKHKS